MRLQCSSAPRRISRENEPSGQGSSHKGDEILANHQRPKADDGLPMDLSTEECATRQINKPSRYKVAVQMKVNVQVNVKSKVTVKVTAPTSWPPALKALLVQ